MLLADRPGDRRGRGVASCGTSPRLRQQRAEPGIGVPEDPAAPPRAPPRTRAPPVLLLGSDKRPEGQDPTVTGSARTPSCCCTSPRTAARCT
ncbi:hypothetical protein QJS66_03280 [Kocuria rhizophila]|nr:hypothetical protein QJS66_03280 [Kocuria rhizophila]